MSPSRLAPVRRFGQWLIRVGTRRQWWWLLLPAELCIRAAGRVSADVSWVVRLGRIQEARKKWAAADATYTRLLELLDRSPAGEHQRADIHHRQGRARAGHQDWDGAQAAYAEAIRLRPDVAAWHAQQAQAYEHQAEWTAAAGCYQEAIRLEPDGPRFLTGLVRTNLKAHWVREAIEAGESGLARVPDHPPLRRALADAYESAGDWTTAAGLLRELVASRPGDRTLRYQLVRCLEQLLRVPAGLTDHGVTVGRPRLPDETVDELVGQLRLLAAHPPQRPNDMFRLGKFYERGGQLAEAAETYRLAMERLSTVDSWWCLKAAYDWEFRLAYVREQLSPSPSPPSQRQLRRRVAPVAHPPTGTEPAGFVDALMARDGLHLSGFLRPGLMEPGAAIALHLDDQLIKRVRVNASSWRPTFRFDLSPGLLGDLPERSRLAVRLGDRPLVNTVGGVALEVCVPGGTGKLGQKLADGLAPNKKGSWPLRGNRLAVRRKRYLDLYDQAKELLEAHGRRIFLSYGTLLGCERHGDFITGDDDFDVSYVSRAADPKAFRRECQRVALELLRQGLDIRFAINGRMLQFGLDNVWIDLAPTWFYRGRAWAFAAHDLTPGSVEPVRVGTFADRMVFLPQDPAAYLADAYGPDWRTPQPDFRHYRSAADNQVLSQMWARPSEVREFTRLAGAERRRRGSAGRFMGVGGTPAYPGFSWLTPAPDETGNDRDRLVNAGFSPPVPAR